MGFKRRRQLEAELRLLTDRLSGNSDARSAAQEDFYRRRLKSVEEERAKLNSETKADKFNRSTNNLEQEMEKQREDENELARKRLFQYNSGNRAA